MVADRRPRDFCFDLAVIGAGINGSAIARDAALRGLTVALIEQDDIGGGTTAASSRLIHGGLRYLEHTEFGLVRESLRERELLLSHAPHLVKPLPLYIPVYRNARRGVLTIRAGLWLYDLLSFDRSLPGHEMLSPEDVADDLPGLEREGLLAVGCYQDAQINYAERLVVENVLDAQVAGARVHTGWRVEGLMVYQGQVQGLHVRHGSSGQVSKLRSRCVVNAAGPWVDRVLDGLLSDHQPLIDGTRGSHLILSAKRGLPARACYVEAARDGRPFFILPWNGQVLVGTTDTRYDGDPARVRCTEREVSYLLTETRRVFPGASIGPGDINYTTAGIRPLPVQVDRDESKVTRRHLLHHHKKQVRGLFSVIGGKLTTQRQLAEDVTDRISRFLGRRTKCITHRSAMPGARVGLEQTRQALARERRIEPASQAHLLEVYGSRALEVSAMAHNDALLSREVCPDTHAIGAELIFGLERELARNLSDCLLRRSMIGLGPTAGLRALERISSVLTGPLGWPRGEVNAQMDAYRSEVRRRQLTRGNRRLGKPRALHGT